MITQKVVVVTVDVTRTYSKEWVVAQYSNAELSINTLLRVTTDAKRIEQLILASQTVAVEIFEAYVALRDLEMSLKEFIWRAE